MIVEKFAFGNDKEAFIEDRFGSQLNVIFSNDNNKGKTLVLQGIMYALGNEPIFPAQFQYKNYYFYISFKLSGKEYKVLRKGNVYTALVDGVLNVIGSDSEFKDFFNTEIFKLPMITHRGYFKSVDLQLFHQIYFVGQDKRNTSGIFNSGFYTKADFIEMLYAMCGLSGAELSSVQINELKSKLKNLRATEKKLSKEIDRFNINKAVLETVKASAAFSLYEKQEAALKKTYGALSDLRKRVNRERSRLNRYKSLKSELNSLNRSIEFGQIVCEECGSNNVTYQSKGIEFDVSNKEVRSSIISSIDKNIGSKEEGLLRLNFEVEIIQKKLDKELSEVKPELRDLILFQDELKNSGSLDQKLRENQKEIQNITLQLTDAGVKKEGLSEQQKELMKSIIIKMNEAYRLVDDNRTQEFDSLFTTNAVNYSGSEEQEFYFSKLYALKEVLEHEFPIIIDSFRERELSTDKEIKMIKILEEMEGQVIVTSTLKKEEYISEKYETYKSITAIDYSSHVNSKILNKDYVKPFHEICSQFGAVI